jgi:hypothetical protein
MPFADKPGESPATEELEVVGMSADSEDSHALAPKPGEIRLCSTV